MTLKNIGPLRAGAAGDTFTVEFVEDDGTTVVPLTGGGSWTAVWRQQKVGEPSSATVETAVVVDGDDGLATLTWTADLLVAGRYWCQATATNGTVVRPSRLYMLTVEPGI